MSPLGVLLQMAVLLVGTTEIGGGKLGQSVDEIAQ
jgi:hypothetical protein